MEKQQSPFIIEERKGHLPSIEDVARQQGVGPIADFESLLGEPSPDDETAEEFAAMLRRWRTEGRTDRGA